LDKQSAAVLAVLLLASGCGAGGSPPPRQPESEFTRLRGPDLARVTELYAAGKKLEAAAILRPMAANENWEVRVRAIRAIGDAKDRDLLPEVHAALADENIEVRESAGRVLQGLADESSIGPLLAALSDPEPVIRMRAVEALASVGGAAQLETLEKVSKNDQDPSVREAAQEALLRLRESPGVLRSPD